jgi:hypothetical protein
VLPGLEHELAELLLDRRAVSMRVEKQLRGADHVGRCLGAALLDRDDEPAQVLGGEDLELALSVAQTRARTLMTLLPGRVRLRLRQRLLEPLPFSSPAAAVTLELGQLGGRLLRRQPGLTLGGLDLVQPTTGSLDCAVQPGHPF